VSVRAWVRHLCADGLFQLRWQRLYFLLPPRRLRTIRPAMRCSPGASPDIAEHMRERVEDLLVDSTTCAIRCDDVGIARNLEASALMNIPETTNEWASRMSCGGIHLRHYSMRHFLCLVPGQSKVE
jgi:hypothetical protein